MNSKPMTRWPATTPTNSTRRQVVPLYVHELKNVRLQALRQYDVGENKTLRLLILRELESQTQLRVRTR